MKMMSLLVGLLLLAGTAHGEVFMEEKKDLFKIPVSRSSEWIVTFGASELEPRGAIYEVNTLTGAKTELYGFADAAFFAKTTDGDYVFTGEGEYSVSIVFTKQFQSDRFTANIKFSGKNAPFEGTARLEECEKYADVK